MTETHELADRGQEWVAPSDGPTQQEWGFSERHDTEKKRRFINMYLNSKSKFMASVYNIYRRCMSPHVFSIC